MVGWDTESFVDPAELRQEWAGKLVQGALPGLVLAEDVHRLLPMARGFEPFAEGFVWIPYRGSVRMT